MVTKIRQYKCLVLIRLELNIGWLHLHIRMLKSFGIWAGGLWGDTVKERLNTGNNTDCRILLIHLDLKVPGLSPISSRNIWFTRGIRDRIRGW